jgi:hypothetical protein
MSKSSAAQQHAIVLSRIEQALLGAAVLAVVAMLSFSGARDAGAMFGWAPFWLLTLPLCAWAVARGLRRRADAALVARPSARVHRLPATRTLPRHRAPTVARRRAA